MKAPAGRRHRLITEDLAQDPVTWADLADRAGIDTPLMDAVIRISSSIHGVDYFRNGPTPENLGLGGLTTRQLTEYVNKGSL